MESKLSIEQVLELREGYDSVVHLPNPGILGIAAATTFSASALVASNFAFSFSASALTISAFAVAALAISAAANASLASRSFFASMALALISSIFFAPVS